MAATRAHEEDDGRTPAAPVAGTAPPAPERGATLLRLQRSAGNSAVGAMLRRGPVPPGPRLARAAPAQAPATGIDLVREKLRDGNEEGSIAAMAALDGPTAQQMLAMQDMRGLAVKCFNNKEMARAMSGLQGGHLVQKLNWMEAEGSSLELVWPLIVDRDVPAAQKLFLYERDYIRDFFVDVCNDDQMAAVVDILGGTLTQKLTWMFHEGTSWSAVVEKLNAMPAAAQRRGVYASSYLRKRFVEMLNDAEMAALVQSLDGTLDQKLAWMAAEGTNFGLVSPKIRDASDVDLATVTPKTRAALKDELSGKDFDKVELMLDSGYLSWETVKQKATEQHYELKDAADPSKGWGLESYEWDTKYDIAYTRTQLRVRVKIGFTGQTATAAHKQLWRAGIRNRWNGHFHLDNGTTKLAFDFDPVWVNSGSQHTIKLHAPVTTGWRENSGNWYAGPTANADPTKTRDSTTGDTAAHEFGHLIGLEDEYRLTAADFQRLVGTAPTAADKAGLGAPGFSHPGLMTAGIGDVEARHLTTFVDWLNAHRRPGEARYSVKAGP